MEVSLNDIQQMVQSMSSENITPKDLCNYNRTKHEIIGNSQNIYKLIEFLQNQELSPQLIIEILKIIHELLNTYQTAFPLDEIFEMLVQLPISDIPLLKTLSDSIVLICVLIYLSENRLLLPITPEKDTVSPLECFVIEGFLEVLPTCIYDKKKRDQMIKDFKRNYVVNIVQFGIRLMSKSDINGVSILYSALSFGIDLTKSQTIVINNLLPLFESEDMFSLFVNLTNSNDFEISRKVIQIITILARGCDKWVRCTKTVANIQFYLKSIFGNEEIFNDQAKVIYIQNLIVAIQPNYPQCPYDSVIQSLYDFCEKKLQTSPLSIIILYTAILTMFSNFHSSNNEFHQHFIKEMIPCFYQYINIMTRTFDQYPDQAYEIIFESENIKQLITSLKRLLEFTDLSQISDFFHQAFSILFNAEVSLSNSFKITFLLIAFNTCFLKHNLFLDDKANFVINKNSADKKKIEVFANLFDILFIILSAMKQKMKDYYHLYDSTEYTFLMPRFLLQNILSILQIFFSNIKQDKQSLDQISPYLKIANTNEVIIHDLFDFLLFILFNGFDNHSVSKVIKVFLNNETLCTAIRQTEFPNQFLENYLSFPCISIYYFILTKIVFNHPEKNEEFLTSLSKHFTQLLSVDNGVVSDENVNRFFQVILAFFYAANETNKWYSFFVFLYQTFGETILKISDSSFSCFVLPFVYSITEKNGKMLLPKNGINFPKISPYSFRIFHYFTLLLTNCLKNIDIKPINIDESVFQSAFPVSDVYFSEFSPFKKENTPNEGQEHESEEDNWDLFMIDLEAMCNFIESPFPNFGIMEYYQDKCIFEYFNCVIMQASKSSPISLLSLPNYFETLLRFLYLFSFNLPNVVISTESYLSFSLMITKIAFLDNNEENLKRTGQILTELCHCITTSHLPLKRFFEQHFILALNLCMSQQSFPEFESFIYWYISNEFEHVTELNKKIANGIEPAEVKQIINESLDILIQQGIFNGNPDDINKFNQGFATVTNIFRQYSIRLDYLSSLSQYFVFS